MLNEALKRIGHVQKIDSAVLELERRFAAIDPGNKVRAQLESARKAKEDAETKLKAVRTELEDLELKSKGIDQKIEAEQKRLYSGGIYNAKEADAIDHEIANLKQRRGQLDDRILALWEEIEPAQAEAGQAAAACDEVSARLKEYEAKYAEVRGEFDSKMAQLVAAREREISQCEPELLAKYEAMRKRRGGIGLAAVVEGQCTACNTVVPKKQLGDIKAGETLETCQNCLRYLYLEDEA